MGADNTFGETNLNPEKMTDNTISAILSHCKANMRIHRDY